MRRMAALRERIARLRAQGDAIYARLRATVDPRERARLERQLGQITKQIWQLRTQLLYAEAEEMVPRLVMGFGMSVGGAAATAKQLTAEAVAQKLAQAGLKVRTEIAEQVAKAINAERAAAQAAQMQAAQAATAEQAAQAMSKAAKRSTWTKEASEKWLEIYRGNIEQAEKRTRAMEKIAKIGATVGAASVLSNVFEASSVLYNAVAGNRDSAALLKYGAMRNASDEANRKLRQQELQLRQAEYQLRLADYLRRTGQLQGYAGASTRMNALSYEQQYALEQARHLWTMQRGQMAAQAELAKIREAAMWQDWRKAREAARSAYLEQLEGAIKQALQEGKYRWESWLQQQQAALKERLINVEQAWEAYREYWDDVRDLTAKLTEQYQKAALEDEVNRRAAAYKVMQEAGIAQVEIAKEQALQAIKYFWERRKEIIDTIRKHARLEQVDESKLWALWRKEFEKIKRAIKRGEPVLTALPVPGTERPAIIKVDPKRPGELVMVTPEGKEVKL